MSSKQQQYKPGQKVRYIATNGRETTGTVKQILREGEEPPAEVTRRTGDARVVIENEHTHKLTAIKHESIHEVL